jgi:hypothetical protein
MIYPWYESYRAAILETDWTKMQERLRSAELEIHQRQHILSLDHGGTPEERQAIANALNGVKGLRIESAAWQPQRPLDGASSQA